jgi:hypothetical protein
LPGSAGLIPDARSSDQVSVKSGFLFTLAAVFAMASAMAESPATAPQTVAEPEQPPVRFVMTHVESLKPQVVRICYLEEGTREIVLPPISQTIMTGSAQPLGPENAAVEEVQVIRILNADEGTREIIVTPKP